jgi:hypothetical protein
MAPVFQQHRFIFVFAGLMLALGALYFAFRAVDGAFLSESMAEGKVVGKEHVPAHEEYQTQNVGGVNRTLKIAVADAWYVVVDLGGPRAKAPVDFSEFTKAAEGDAAVIRYKKHRITGNMEVTQYAGKGE